MSRARIAGAVSGLVLVVASVATLGSRAWSGAGPVTASDPCANATPGAAVFPADAGPPGLCLAETGSAPNIEVVLYAGGVKLAAYHHDSCSWPNAGRHVLVAGLPQPDGQVVVWGTVPAGATGVKGTLADGSKVTAATVGPSWSPERYFAVMASSAPLSSTFQATGASGPPPAPVASPSCEVRP